MPASDTHKPEPSHPFNRQGWRKRIVAARGSGPADLLLAGGQVANVFTGELETANVAVAEGKIVGVGSQYSRAHSYIDCREKVIAPSFVDPHIHLESSMIWLPEFARAVVPHGTGAVVADPHEIANVAGLEGINAMRQSSQGLPLHVRFTAPSSVPASSWESPGARFGVEEIAAMLEWPETVGLGELMNVAGAISGDAQIGFKLEASGSRRRDGHAPGVVGTRLQTYLAAGVHADHESTTLEEAYEKLRNGLFIMIREGSSERNLKDLLPLAANATFPRCAFCSDDRDCRTLHVDGHIDAIVRLAIAEGLDPVRAIRMASWNPADHWRLDGIGAVAPGFEANLIILDDLQTVTIGKTLFQGKVVAESGELVAELPSRPAPTSLTSSFNMAAIAGDGFPVAGDAQRSVICVVPGQIVTRLERLEQQNGSPITTADPSQDLLKLVCVERHKATGRIGAGFVRGFGLKSGALASSVAHDAHNIVAVGVDDADIRIAVERVAELGGGLVVVDKREVVAELPLPIAGIMSDRSLREVVHLTESVEQAARDLGSTLAAPFGTLAFMALSVIPEARITDKGLVLVS
ncbi:adenine deaminase [soil metagenome]